MSFDRLKPAFHAVPGCALVLRFDDEGRAAPGDADDVAHIGAPGEGFVWLHLHLDDPNVDAMLKRLSVLNDDARKTLFDDLPHFSVTSIRRGFAGGGFAGKRSLPKKMAMAAGVPGAAPEHLGRQQVGTDRP